MRRTRRLKTPTRRTKQRRSTRTAPTRPRTTSRSISTPTDIYRTTSSPRKMPRPSAGRAGRSSPTHRASALAAAGSATTKVSCPRRTDAGFTVVEVMPGADGRTYTECDIDTLGADSRGAKRIVFSNDGLIYYTEDHYKSFELLYGEE